MTKRVSLIQMLEKQMCYFTNITFVLSHSSAKKKICQSYQQITLICMPKDWML